MIKHSSYEQTKKGEPHCLRSENSSSLLYYTPVFTTPVFTLLVDYS